MRAEQSTWPKVRINSPSVEYGNEHILAEYSYSNCIVKKNDNGILEASPTIQHLSFKTEVKPAKVGVMLIGWGGNNGSTLTAAVLANKKGLSWETRDGLKSANYFGSLCMSSTVKLGVDELGQEVFIPFTDILPMAHPNDFVIGGWDISSMNLADAMDRAKVLEPSLKDQLREDMKKMKPLPSIYYPDFIAANQSDRADNVLLGSKSDHLEQIRKDIRTFKSQNELDLVVVLWTANTERFSDIIVGVNDTYEALQRAIQSNHSEISPSAMFATAAILEGCPFINGSPQNTFVPGVIDLALQKGVFIGGDDFKSGQTKMKSVLVDFLVNAGIKPISITSYNHLGNNDGKNLSEASQFRSKEISKSNVVDDMVACNRILYKEGEQPDHVVVIKYIPAVGDSKRALDEYENEIFMGGRNTISIHNTCEDSLLASPLIIDLVLLTELFNRITFKKKESESFEKFHPVLSFLSYMLKAPLVPDGSPVINSLQRQRSALENILRACVGLQPKMKSNKSLSAKCFLSFNLLYDKGVEMQGVLHSFMTTTEEQKADKNWSSILKSSIETFFGLFVVLLALLGALVSYHVFPLANAPSQNSLSFSGKHAYSMLEELCKFNRPYGSYGNILGKNFIVSELEKIKAIALQNGLDFDFDVQTDDSSKQDRELNNIVARLGGKNSQALLYSSHYDSVPASFGATDDGSGVAIGLELLYSLISAKFVSDYSLVVLFNNGEEVFCVGSKAFFEKNHKWANDIRAFINFEGNGAGGKSVLFQASDYDLTAFISQMPYPHVSILGNDIYKSGLIQSYTDYDVYDRQAPGLNFAYYRNTGVYHTSRDSIENLSAGELQQSGDNILAITVAILKSSYLKRPKGPSRNNPVFYSIPGNTIVNLPLIGFKVFNGVMFILGFVMIFLIFKFQSKIMIRTAKRSLASASFYVFRMIMSSFILGLLLNAGLIAMISGKAIYGMNWLMYSIPICVVGIVSFAFSLFFYKEHKQSEKGEFVEEAVTDKVKTAIDDSFWEIMLGDFYYMLLFHGISTLVGFLGFGFFYFSSWTIFMSILGVITLLAFQFVESKYLNRYAKWRIFSSLKYGFYFIVAKLFPGLMILEAVFLVSHGLGGRFGQYSLLMSVAISSAIYVITFNVAVYLKFVTFFATKWIKVAVICLLCIILVIFIILGFASSPYSSTSPFHLAIERSKIVNENGSFIFSGELKVAQYRASSDPLSLIDRIDGFSIVHHTKHIKFDALPETTKGFRPYEIVMKTELIMTIQIFDLSLETMVIKCHKIVGDASSEKITNRNFKGYKEKRAIIEVAKNPDEECEVTIKGNINCGSPVCNLFKGLPEWTAVSSMSITGEFLEKF